MAPVFVPGSRSTPYGKDALVVGQKNGNLYAMSAEAGELFWATATSPGGAFGGLSWGVAVDDSQVYFTAINSIEKAWQLEPSGQTVIRSAYGAASLSNGSLLWETGSPLNGVAYGPPTVVGDLVLVARTGFDPNQTLTYDSTNGSLIVIQKATGNILTAIGLSSNFHGGIAVQGQDIMFGTGYSPSFSPQSSGSFEVMRVVG
jgi:outer membrane protein assembly factor BamB